MTFAIGRFQINPRIDPAELRRATEAFLDQIAAWQWFATPTFRRTVSLDEGVAAVRAWAEALTSELRVHVQILWGVEAGGMFGRTHGHALLAPWGPSLRIDADTVERLWLAQADAGEIEIRRYERTGGAASYTAKGDRIGCGVVCPRPRPHECRRRCLGGPGPF